MIENPSFKAYIIEYEDLEFSVGSMGGGSGDVSIRQDLTTLTCSNNSVLILGV